MIVANRTLKNNNHNNNRNLHVFFPFYLNTKYIINISLEWKWKILWLKFYRRMEWMLSMVFFKSNDDSDEDSLLDLLQSNTFPGIIWVFNDMSSWLWMHIYQRREATWAQFPTRETPALHWQYQIFIGSNSSLESNCTHR